MSLERTDGKEQGRKLRDQGGGHCNNPGTTGWRLNSGSSGGSGEKCSGSGETFKGEVAHFAQGLDLSVCERQESRMTLRFFLINNQLE